MCISRQRIPIRCAPRPVRMFFSCCSPLLLVQAEAGASKTPQPWSSSAAPSNPNEIGNDGLNHGQRLLKELFESPECVESESGFSVKDVSGASLYTSFRLAFVCAFLAICKALAVALAHQAVRRLGNQLSEKQVKEAIGFLVQECHIYTTIDDDHYKSTIA